MTQPWRSEKLYQEERFEGCRGIRREEKTRTDGIRSHTGKGPLARRKQDVDTGPPKASMAERMKLRKCRGQQVAGEASQSQMVQGVLSGLTIC